MDIKMTKTLMIFGEDISYDSYDDCSINRDLLFCDRDIPALILAIDRIFEKCSYTRIGNLYERRYPRGYDNVYFCLTGYDDLEPLESFPEFCHLLIKSMTEDNDEAAVTAFTEWVTAETARLAEFKKAIEAKYLEEQAREKSEKDIAERVKFLQLKIKYCEPITPEELDFLQKNS